MPICHACELLPSQIQEFCDEPDDPYVVCEQCHIRLMSRSLRPVEWFNLTKRHGWEKYLLHDDFYDQDGEAIQPLDDVEEPQEYPAPGLDQFRDSPELLLDYSTTRWVLDESVQAAWRALPSGDVVRCLHTQLATPGSLTRCSVTLRVAALIGPECADLTELAWQLFPERVSFRCLVDATVNCLPLEAGFERTAAALKQMSPEHRSLNFGTLAQFRSIRTLDWIEAHVPSGVTESWGNLAAASNLSWRRAETWFRSGRPLSLVALDALCAIADPRTVYLRQIRPVLIDPPSERELREMIHVLIESDDAIRVRQRSAKILKSTANLVS